MIGDLGLVSEARSKHNWHLTLKGDSYSDQHIVSKLLEVSNADVLEPNHSTPKESKPMLALTQASLLFPSNCQNKNRKKKNTCSKVNVTFSRYKLIV